MITHTFLSYRMVYLVISPFLLLIFAPTRYCQGYDANYTKCAKPFSCGALTDVAYPFWAEEEGVRSILCGLEGFRLRCTDGQFPIIVIENQEFLVKSVNQTGNEMTIAPKELSENRCPATYNNITLDTHLFSLTPDFYMSFSNISLFYNCSDLSDTVFAVQRFACSGFDAFYGYHEQMREWMQETKKCNITIGIAVQKSFLRAGGILDLEGVIGEGFNISYKYNERCGRCRQSGGICGTNTTKPSQEFTCLCPDHPYPLSCSSGKSNVKTKVIIGVSVFAGTAALMSIFFIFFIYQRRKKNPYAPSSLVSQTNTSDFSSKFDMERGGSMYGVQLFTYEQLEEATDHFDPKKELGEGGFGTVYFGKLQDGRCVAVKRLYENNYKRVEQFLNEVDLLTRLRHPHLVSLYGCTSRHSRELLLVYEYIPNGTVADHLHGEKAKPGSLPWHTRMNIATETASALTYLHASDIIHRDVKTNNILLDDNFGVKVADFGLSRLFPLHVTHVSTAPQGTPGYVDPEYHECYQLTDKSDVYSFGVVLVELISSMPAVDITRHRHEINLSNMAINKIQSNALNELVDRSLGFDSDYAVRKMISAVAELAFQCLQSAKELRPTMDEVLETLKLIKDKDYSLEKKQEMDRTSDDVGLLKGGQLPHSPDTVMIQWKSSRTTPNTSG